MGFSLTVLSLLAPPCGQYKINFTVKPELVFWLILAENPTWSRTGSDNSCLVLFFFYVCRSSRAVLQPDVVPQPRPRPHVHPSDRLGQRPLHPALGQEEALHPGSLHRHAHRGGAVPQRVADRWERRSAPANRRFFFVPLKVTTSQMWCSAPVTPEPLISGCI